MAQLPVAGQGDADDVLRHHRTAARAATPKAAEAIDGLEVVKVAHFSPDNKTGKFMEIHPK